MSTLLEIKTAVANSLNVSLAALTQNSQDLFLLAANQVRKTAELNHDFEFNRKLVTVSVDGATGGDLGAAIDSTSAVVDVKTVIEAGILDEESNFIPVEWTTNAESLERQRGDNAFTNPRYPTDGWARATPGGISRFTFSGSTINRWPKTSESDLIDFSLVLEAYCFTADWTSSDLLGNIATVAGTLSPDVTGTYARQGDYNGYPFFMRQFAAPNDYTIANNGGNWFISNAGTPKWHLVSSNPSPAGLYTPDSPSTGTATVTLSSSTSDVWTTHGQQFLQWAVVVHLNKIFMRFVPRQEGVLPPPTDLASEGLQSLLDWDNNKYEQFRRHGR